MTEQAPATPIIQEQQETTKNETTIDEGIEKENKNHIINNDGLNSPKNIKNDTNISSGNKSAPFSPSSNSNEKNAKKPVLKQMKLTDIAKTTSPKLKTPESSLPKPEISLNSTSEIPKVPLNQSTIEIKTETNNETKGDKENAESENGNKISFSKRNIVKILGSNYNKDKQLVFAVQLKKPNKTVYVLYTDLKKRSPQILCDYFENLITFK